MLSNLLRRDESRAAFPPLSLAQYAQQMERFSFMGNQYAVGGERHVAELVATNAALAAVVGVRAKVFAEISFKFQRYEGSRLGQLFGTPALQLLERPWAGASTSHLLAIMELDVSVFGNSYWIVSGGELVRLDPRHVSIATAEVVESDSGIVIGSRVVGYAYRHQGSDTSAMFLPSEVAHYRLDADPSMPHRGVSWLRSVLADASADEKMTGYKSALLENSAVPGMVLRAEPGVSLEQFEAAREMLRTRHTGWDKVGRTLLLGAGFDVQVVGSTMQQLDMKAIQGAGETRIAAAAGVPASIVGFSEGLQGSALNAGNYGATRRRFADGTMRPLWRAACAALSTIVQVPTGSRLWYDERDVAFLQEDVKDEADIRSRKALTIESLIRAGFQPNAAAEFAQTGDEQVLIGQHTGLYSVQLQPPAEGQPNAV